MRPDIVLKIKEEVKRQFDAGFLQEVNYSDWVANIVPVPKKDGKLKLNPAKCTFGARSGKLLGFIVSKKGIEVDPDKVKAIRDLPPPRTQKEVRGFLGRLNYIARFISQLTEKCDPVFRLLKKHNPGEWDEECQRAFDKIKQYLVNTPVLSPPSPDRSLILYLTVLENSMGCVLGQHDETGKNENAIYYLSKKFTDCEMRYSSIEKLCCALIWATRRLRQWQILLSEFDIVYVSQKAIKGSSIADFLASRALEDYEFLNFDFPNEDLKYVANTEEKPRMGSVWRLNFDGASNATEYEACIMGIRAAIERNIKVLRVYGDSALVIYQLKGEWETRDPKLIDYRKLVLELAGEFDDITFCYLPREENQMADALATLASMIQVNRLEVMRPIQMSIYETPAHCCNIEEEGKDDCPWYQNILQYVKDREYPNQATENDKRTLRRMAIEYVLDGEVLYKRRKDQVLLRCVDAVEAKKILEEVHEGICGTHANGFMMARQIMRFGTSTGATPFSLVYGMEAVLPIEVEIPSLRVLSELQLDEADWIQSRYDQLNLIEEKSLRAIRHGQMYQKRMMRAYNKKVRPREFREGDLVLKKILPMQKDSRGKWMPNWEGPYIVKKAFSGGTLILCEMDGKSLPNPVNADSIKKYFT
ncbi:uncharacterized protein LOC128035548 [Gossypium raimondii]|uniref:uncharacterized protein LOC128035548 n=1 Tax=Gossypium raimondii TaxID=29730 RepID=UPI00227C20D1|nr:uncharacterized protein LOC128035548 [Gossypium raimondii]